MVSCSSPSCMRAGSWVVSRDTRPVRAASSKPLPTPPAEGLLLCCFVRMQPETRAEFAHSALWDQGHFDHTPQIRARHRSDLLRRSRGAVSRWRFRAQDDQYPGAGKFHPRAPMSVNTHTEAVDLLGRALRNADFSESTASLGDDTMLQLLRSGGFNVRSGALVLPAANRYKAFRLYLCLKNGPAALEPLRRRPVGGKNRRRTRRRTNPSHGHAE